MSGPRRGRLLPHHDSSQVAAALFGEAAAPQRRTRPPAGPNHVAANKQSVRAKSDANRLARQQQDADVRPLRPRARRSSSEGGAPPRAARPAGGRDFVAENAAAAAMAGMRRRSAGGDADKSGHPAHAPGEVPQYLLQRKLELAAQYVEEQVGGLMSTGTGQGPQLWAVHANSVWDVGAAHTWGGL